MIKVVDSANKRERARLLELANEYKAKGYEVFLEPDIEQRPEFLQNYQPDLIAISPTDKVIIEVKSKKSLKQSSYLETLAREIENQKGWRLEFVLTNPREQQDTLDNWSLLPVSELQGRLKYAKALFHEQQQEGSGMLLLWIVVEATLQHIAKLESINLTRPSPKLLVKELFSLGVLDDQEYETLSQAVDLRNRIVHGYTTYTSISSVFDTTVQIVSKMLCKLEIDKK